jgi:hypothetical protein
LQRRIEKASQASVRKTLNHSSWISSGH